MEAKEKIKDLKKRLSDLISRLKIGQKEKRKGEIEEMMGKPSFWENKERAERSVKELSGLKEDIEEVEKIKKQLDEAETMVELKMTRQVQEKLNQAEKDLERLETKTFLSGPYDSYDVILSIHAGQGGTEAMDWTQMLQRMYSRYAQGKGWEVDVIDFSPGEEAGVKSVTMQVLGPYSFGLLRGEAGVHRLVRQSPFNADRLRQTSFALVEVLPQLEEEKGVKVKEDELEWQFFRASSPGGQYVQKVSTAVRLKHKPSGITVVSQSERYQEQNRKIALSLLKAKLWLKKSQEEQKKKRRLKGEYKTPGWGNQIRSYVLHPYKMVKDLRTGVETKDPEAVLDGELDKFIEAELKEKV